MRKKTKGKHIVFKLGVLIRTLYPIMDNNKMIDDARVIRLFIIIRKKKNENKHRGFRVGILRNGKKI